MKRLLNGIIVDMTTAEQNELTNVRNQASEFQTAWDSVDETKLAELNVETETINTLKKAKSGKQKLLDLGLSEEEVKALIGV